MSEANSFEGLLQNVENVYALTTPAKICETVLRKLKSAGVSKYMYQLSDKMLAGKMSVSLISVSNILFILNEKHIQIEYK